MAKLPLVPFWKRRLTLEIGAGQIIEQHVVSKPKKIPPSLLQKAEQRCLVRHQFVQATIGVVFGHQSKILVEQIPHRALAVPLSVQTPLAARIDPTIGAQHHQQMIPGGSLPTGSQTLLPELTQLQLLPQPPEHPAGAPLPRTMNTQLGQAHLHRKMRSVNRNGPITGEKRQLGLLLSSHIKGFANLEPLCALRIVDFAQIKNVALDPTAPSAQNLFSEAVIMMLLAILET